MRALPKHAWFALAHLTIPQAPLYVDHDDMG